MNFQQEVKKSSEALQDNLLAYLDGQSEEMKDMVCNMVVEEFKTISKKIGDELSRRKTGEEAAMELERFVNVMCNCQENDNFVEYIVHRTHRTLNQGIMGLIFAIIKEEAKNDALQRYDARNEASVKACAKLSPLLEDVYLPFI